MQNMFVWLFQRGHWWSMQAVGSRNDTSSCLMGWSFWRSRTRSGRLWLDRSVTTNWKKSSTSARWTSLTAKTQMVTIATSCFTSEFSVVWDDVHIMWYCVAPSFRNTTLHNQSPLLSLHVALLFSVSVWFVSLFASIPLVPSTSSGFWLIFPIRCTPSQFYSQVTLSPFITRFVFVFLCTRLFLQTCILPCSVSTSVPEYTYLSVLQVHSSHPFWPLIVFLKKEVSTNFQRGFYRAAGTVSVHSSALVCMALTSRHCVRTLCGWLCSNHYVGSCL